MSDAYPDHRPNVGLVLFNADGLVWVGRRNGADDPWRWQFPQGGIDPGETPQAAGLRELFEETGIKADQVEEIGRIDDWLAYDYPPEVRDDPRFARKRHLGQKQRWFAYRFLGKDSDFDLEAHGEVEFDAFRWVPLADTAAGIIPWKRPVYETVIAQFAHLAAPADVD